MKIIIFLSVLITVLPNIIFSQSNISLKINVYDDTAKSVVNHNKYNIKFVCNDTDKIIMDYSYSYMESKFSTGTWEPIISRINKSNIPPTRKSSFSFDTYFNLLPVLVTNDSLLNLIQINPSAVYVRYHLRIKINGGQYEDFYSNIDTLTLPLPHTEDVQAIMYIRSSGLTVMKLVNLEANNGKDEYNWYKYLSENFTNSVIGDMGKMIVFRRETLRQCQSTDTGYIVPPEVKLLVTNTCNTLMTSKSDFVRQKASDFLNFINEQN